MSAALGLKVRTVVSLYLWGLIRTRALGEPGSEGVRRTGRHAASRRARHRGHADAHGRLVRIPARAGDGKAKHAIRPGVARLLALAANGARGRATGAAAGPAGAPRRGGPGPRRISAP